MENKEIQIRFSDIAASFLKSIVLILVVTIVLGTAMAGFGVYRAKRVKVDPSIQETINTLNKDVTSKQESVHRLEDSNKTILNVNIPYTEKKVARDEKLTQSRRQYIEESIFSNIDPFNCGVSRVSFAIDIPVPEDAKEEYAQYRTEELGRLVNACVQMYPLSDANMAKVKSIIGSDVEKKYIDELISIENSKDEMVKITVVHNDPEIAKKVTDYLFDQLSAEITSISPDAIITVVSSNTGTEVNWSMNNTQVSYQDSLLLAEKNLASDQESITSSYKTIEDNKKSIEDINEEIKKINDDIASNQKKLNAVIAKKDLLKSAIKFGLVGAVAGLALACAYVYVRDVLGGKVRNRNNILSRYSYPLLGALPGSKKYIFDKTVKRLEGDSVYEKKDIIASSSASILAAVAADGGKTCLIGPVDAKDPSFADLLKSLKGRVEYKGNILSGSEAIKNLEGYDKVILVEKRCASRYDSINEEISRIRALHKDVLGFVLL
ncbi:MAG: hypothetical protein IK020_09900 [Clostridiales bacterium]|nr:hypothetical protein [Clostridiales bacterium]